MSLLDSLPPVPTRSLPVVLLLDTSGSMLEHDKINVLNVGVGEMIEVLKEVDAGHGAITLSIVTFGGESAKVVVSHQPVADIEFTPLRAGGRTPLGQALKLALRLIEDRVALPSRAYRPTIALVSDGVPTDLGWEQELKALVTSERGAKTTRFALAIGGDADHALLEKFSGGKTHEASEAAEIRKFLRFVTTTVTQITQSESELDVSPVSDREESILRLQGDDAF